MTKVSSLANRVEGPCLVCDAENRVVGRRVDEPI
jgi:hypothetical protein